MTQMSAINATSRCRASRPWQWPLPWGTSGSNVRSCCRSRGAGASTAAGSASEGNRWLLHTYRYVLVRQRGNSHPRAAQKASWPPVLSACQAAEHAYSSSARRAKLCVWGEWSRAFMRSDDECRAQCTPCVSVLGLCAIRCCAYRFYSKCNVCVHASLIPAKQVVCVRYVQPCALPSCAAVARARARCVGMLVQRAIGSSEIVTRGHSRAGWVRPRPPANKARRGNGPSDGIGTHTCRLVRQGAARAARRAL